MVVRPRVALADSHLTAIQKKRGELGKQSELLDQMMADHEEQDAHDTNEEQALQRCVRHHRPSVVSTAGFAAAVHMASTGAYDHNECHAKDYIDVQIVKRALGYGVPKFLHAQRVFAVSYNAAAGRPKLLRAHLNDFQS